MLISNDIYCRIYLFQDVKVHSLVTRPQEDCCCFLPDLNFHRGQTESPPSNYYIGGSTCMTSMYRVCFPHTVITSANLLDFSDWDKIN